MAPEIAKHEKKSKKDKKEKSSSKKRDRSASPSVKSKDKKSVKSSESKKKRKSEDGESSSKKKKSKTRSSSVEKEETVIDMSGENAQIAPVEEVELDPSSLDKYRISEATKARLRSSGIASLFPIQSSTFDLIYDGNDVIGRARTGTGKTLSFALPVLERLLTNQRDNRRQMRGRRPVVLVMCPTRELAKQVAGEFERITDQFKVLTVYGGVPYWEQENVFRAGVDIVVGTPGRIMDHLERGNLIVDELEYVVLDEADQMLDIGFADAMESILSQVKQARQDKIYQTMLFSATLPSWVHDVTHKYLRKQCMKTVDLIGNEKLKTNENIKHYAIQCPWQQRAATLGDVLKMYGGGSAGRAIIFTETKNEANELALGDELGKNTCQVLHGDIAQKQREITLQSFRDGKVRALIATDVAARGLDIPEVDLVVQCNPPKDVDTFVHRSGRTGRAGKSGICITFFKPVEEWCLNLIQKKTGITFQRIGAPQVTDMLRSATTDTVKSLQSIDPQVIPLFMPIADDIINGTQELSHLEACIDEHSRAKTALALALAMLTNTMKLPKSRSLLTSQEGMMTFMMSFKQPMRTVGLVRSVLTAQFPEIERDEWRSFRMTKDQCSALFDLPEEKLNGLDLVQLWNERANSPNTIFEVAKNVPELQERDLNAGQNQWNNNGGNRGNSYGNRGNRYGARNGTNQRGGGGSRSGAPRGRGGFGGFNKRQ